MTGQMHKKIPQEISAGLAADRILIHTTHAAHAAHVGETGEALPAAETARLFRGSGTIGGPFGPGIVKPRRWANDRGGCA